MSVVRVANINDNVGAAIQSVRGNGRFLQCVTATSGFTNQTITSLTPVALTGMSATITPKFTTSKIIIEAVVSASWSYIAGIYIYKDGATLIPAHGSNILNGGTNALWTVYHSAQGDGNQVFPYRVLYEDSPNTTSAVTYDLRANAGISGVATAFYLNNRNSLDMLSSSHMALWEVGV